MSGRHIATARRQRVRRSLAALALAVAGCSHDEEPPPSARPPGELPDIVLYLVDTLRADALGAYGATRGDSPAIDAFAAQAAVFESAISQAPWTLPSVTSLLTSSYPSSHRILGHFDSVGPQAETLVEWLKARGYHTVGFATNSMGGRTAGLAQGYDEFTEHQSIRRPNSEPQPEGVDPLQPLFDWAAGDHGGSPYFLYVHTVEPHDPYEGVPDAGDGRYVGTEEERTRLQLLIAQQRRLDAGRLGGALTAAESRRLDQITAELSGRAQDVRDLYDGDVRRADANFGRLIDLLSRGPRWEDTIVILLSDHGEEFHEHGSWFHGHSAYQEVLHVPLVLRAPGLTDAGLRIAEPVQLIDVLPTLADLLGAPASPAWQGRSLLPLLRGEDVPPSPVFSMRIITERKLEGGRGSTETALIDEGWKLIVHHDVGRMSLFHLATDPAEQRDLAAEEPERARAMLAEVQRQLRDLPVLPILDTSAQDAEERAQRQEHLEDLGYVERVGDR